MNFNEKVMNTVFPCLPHNVRLSLAKLIDDGEVKFDDLSEIRIRVGTRASITCNGINMPIDGTVDFKEMAECVTKFCHGSVYAHDSTMKAGYIQFDNGVRVGVCGTFSAEGRGIREITSLNIRLPHIISGVSNKIMEICYNPPKIKSLLIYSLPGVGKTTLLRDVASRLSSEYMRRVALIDTRGELYISDMFKGGICDVLIGYPRALGMEIATRTLSPEVIICDELGDMEEARRILEAQNTGVPIIASAHGDKIEELLCRPNIRLLHENGVFDEYIRISRGTVNGRLTNTFRFEHISAKELC